MNAARISSIVFDKQERPLRATIRTQAGTVKVEWQEVCGDRCWFTAGGNVAAKGLALPAIARIERMIERH
jgi:hypothetical protein